VRGRNLIVALAAALLVGCSSEDGPTTVDLSRLEVRGLVPSGEVARGPHGPIVLETEGEQRWLGVDLEAGDWTPTGEPGRFKTLLPVLSVGRPSGGGAPYRLAAGEEALAYESDPERFGEQPGQFTTDGLDLTLQLGDDAEPPASLRLRACISAELRDGDQRRVEGRRISGSGFWVPPGQSRTIDLALPPNSVLHLATLSTAVLGERAARMATQRFVVELDGAVLLEHDQENPIVGESVAWHRIELPHGGVQRAHLTFRVEGPFAATSILAPVLRPAEPERDGRQNVLVFLADTFRADNLAATGGTIAGLTPALDAFASEARVFERALSVSTHTLPTHSSLFSGVYPPQNGQVDYTTPLAGEVVTLAERLAAAGYRCGAITDGIMVSAAHGLNQGFELFDERRGVDPIERLKAFLDADDGRPVFLFFQSYRTHAPYQPEAATVERWRERLGVGRDYPGLLEDVEALYASHRASHMEVPPRTAEQRALASELEALYRATVPDLDELFAGWLGEVEGRGLTANGVVVFTSDHGESFFEHGRAFHAGPVWDEELHVPLLIRAPGLAPGVESRPVSLIDFAPTVAAWTGLEPALDWEGRSLLAPDDGRPLYAFQSHRAEGKRLAVLEGSHKLIGTEDAHVIEQGTWYGAYDLESDPAELSSLLGVESWPEALAERRHAELLRLLEPRVAPGTTSLTGEQASELNELGYGGDAESR
jgi:arylsulfatase A-like enzyme